MRHYQSFRKYTFKFLLSFSATAVLFTNAIALGAPPGSGWQLKFNDEFDGPKLDNSKWSPCYYWGTPSGCTNGGAGDLQWFQSDEVLVRDGILRLRAQKRQSNGKD